MAHNLELDQNGQAPMFFTGDVPNAFATVRTDTNVVLGLVGSRYQPVQNKDAFNFFGPLVNHDEAIYHTAGVLGRGEKIWLLAKLPDYIKVGPKNDPIEKFVLLYNSHDGSSHIKVMALGGELT